MARLAFFTIGVFHEPRGHAAQGGFFDRLPAVYEAAEQCEGFIDRTGFDADRASYTWGPPTCPSYVSPDLQPCVVHTFSLWRDLESVFAYAYAGLHAEALSRRRDWFREASGPGYVAWWVADDHTPSTAEGAAQLDRLHEAGPTFEAFDFRQPFDAAGSLAKLDVSQVKLARKQIGR